MGAVSIAEPAAPSPASYKIVVRKGSAAYEFADQTNRRSPYRELRPGDLVLVGAHPDNDLRLENDLRQEDGRQLEDVQIAEHHAHIVCKDKGVFVRRIAARRDVAIGQNQLVPWEDTEWPRTEDLLIGPYRLTLIELSAQAKSTDTSAPIDAEPNPSSRPALPAGLTNTPNTLEIAFGRPNQPLRLTPGQVEQWQLLIRNGYSEPYTLDWDISASPALAADFTPRQSEDVRVPAAGWRSIDLDVYVPRTPRSQAGRYTLTATLRAREDQAIGGVEIKRELIVAAFAQPPEIAIRPLASSFSSARYAVRVVNPTNTIVAYRLAAAEKQPDRDELLPEGQSNLECTFQPADSSRAALQGEDLLIIQPGASETVHMLVKLKKGITAPSQGYVVWLEARAPGQKAKGARAFFEPRWWSGWQIERRTIGRALLWTGLVLVLIGLLIGEGKLLGSAVALSREDAVERFNRTATSYLATQIALVQSNVYSTSTVVAQTAAPMQTSTAALAETSRAVGLSITAAAATVSAVAGTATAGAQAVPSQLTAAAQAAQSMATQVGAVAAATIQAGRDQQTAQAAPVQTIMAAETAKAVAEQNATSVNAAAAQAAAAQAAQTAAVAATLVAIDTKPVKVGFSQKPPKSIAPGSQPVSLGMVVGILLDKSGNPSTRDGYIIQVRLDSCGTNTLLGTTVHASERGLITFSDLKIADASGNGAPTPASCSLRIKELNDHLSGSSAAIGIS